MNPEQPRRKARTLPAESLLKLSLPAIGIPAIGWIAVLLLVRVLLRVGWIELDQASTVSATCLMCAPLHVLVLFACAMVDFDFVELVLGISWRTLGALVGAAAPIFVAVVTTNLVLNDGRLSLAQTMIGAVAAHAALLCVLPLFGRLDGRR